MNLIQYKSRCRLIFPDHWDGCLPPRQDRPATILLLMRVAMKAAIARVIVAGIPEDADAPEPRIVGFFNVPTAFIADLRDAELSTLKVYLCLCSNANNQTKRTFISVPRIAAKTGICVRSVHYALRWLESRKWIKANRS